MIKYLSVVGSSPAFNPISIALAIVIVFPSGREEVELDEEGVLVDVLVKIEDEVLLELTEEVEEEEVDDTLELVVGRTLEHPASKVIEVNAKMLNRLFLIFTPYKSIFITKRKDTHR